MSTVEMLSGTCTCGAAVAREKAHGKFSDFINRRPFTCEACSERQQAESDEADRQIAEERRRSLLAARRNASQLPCGLHDVRFDLLDSHGCADALAAARRWANRDLPGLVLTGKFGTGKTSLAAAAINQLLETRSATWVSVASLFAMLGRGFGDQERDIASRAITDSGPLVLDDLDKARPSEYGAEVVFAAIDQRITHRAPLLVTTNLTPGQLATRWPQPYGEAIASRLIGYCTTIQLTGPDRRLT
jgi:DNA replication protein DnaC